MRATIATVDHRDQRYETTGDWRVHTLLDDVNVHVKVSSMRNWRHEFLVGLHELIEATLCHEAGIIDEAVTLFDKAYEAARSCIESEAENDAPLRFYQRTYGCRCKITDTSEPGDDIHAPYFEQHQFATTVEKATARRLGVDWDEYELANLDLYRKANQHDPTS